MSKINALLEGKSRKEISDVIKSEHTFLCIP